jgi:hypothetical protein
MRTQRRFSPVGFGLALGLTILCGGVLLLLRYAGAALGDDARFDWMDAFGMTAVCLAIGVWFGYRKNHAMALEAVKFRQRWRKGQWTDIFGFALGLSVAGVALGLILSVPKWLQPPAGGALDYTLITVAACALAGFVGGFGSQISPVRYRVRA